MRTYTYVILGGGVAAGYAAQEFAEVGYDGDLAIISADDRIPYERPPLSKSYLTGDVDAQDILINDAEFYAKHDIDVLLETRIERIDTANNTLYTSGDDAIRYENLLIATGSRVKTLDIPGADLEGLEYLRSLDDASEIRHDRREVFNAVVLGGGYIGMEVAAQLQGEGVATTMVFPSTHVMESRFFTPEMATFFEDYYRERDVKFVKQTKPAAFHGTDGQLTAVELENGDTLETNLVVAGIGVEPNDHLFRDSQIATEDGVLVDQYLQTNVDNVYAIGDVARYHDVVYDRRRQIGHWNNAVVQGQYAARRMTGNETAPFREVPYFFSDVFDLSYEFWGDREGADEIIHRGDVHKGSFSTWFIRDNRLIAAFVMDRPDDEREFAKTMTGSDERINVDMLRHDDQTLNVPA